MNNHIVKFQGKDYERFPSGLSDCKKCQFWDSAENCESINEVMPCYDVGSDLIPYRFYVFKKKE